MRLVPRRVARFSFSAPAALCSALLFAVGSAAAETLRLKDGTTLQGEVLSKDDSTVVFRSATLGDLRIPRSALLTAAFGPANRAAMTAGQSSAETLPADPNAESGGKPGRDPSDHALFFMPTAFTPPARSFMFRDFELLFLTFGFAPTASTTVTGGFLFPITSKVQLLTAGFKQKLWEGKGSAVAVTGNITNPVGEFMDDIGYLVNANLVAGFRAPNPLGASDGFGAHIALGYLGNQEIDEEYNSSNGEYSTRKRWSGKHTLGVGAEFRLTRNAKFIGEFLNTAPFGNDDDFDGGLLTLGFRLHGNRLSADIAGLRPILSDNPEGLFLWPLLVVSYRI